MYAATPKPLRADRAIQRIRALRDELFARTKLPRRLSETGKVTQEQLARLAEMAIDEGQLMFNPKEMDFDDALALLKRAW